MPGVFILQDFTAYTEVDPENELTVSSDEIVCACPGTDILGEHILNVYKDFGAGGIGNFSYKFAFSVSPKQETDGLILCSICGVTESSLNFYDYSYINNSDGVLIVITMGPWDETPSLQLYGCGSVDNLVIAFNTTYYVLITRSGNAISCKVYSDSSYEILIQELTGTYSDDCRYIILTMPDTYDPRPEAAANGSFRGSVSDLYIYTELNPQVITPIAQPNSSSLTYGTYVKLLCLTPNATIRYTLDGSTPDGTSTIYVSPVAITQNTVLKAIAFKIDYEDSNIGTFTYTVKVSNPEATPTPRYFKDSITVALSCATPGAEIRYTLDGSEPDINSKLYTKPLLVTM